MQEIASAADIDDSDVIQYVIDGINDSVNNKIILYNAKTITDLKEALQKYDRIKMSQNNVERRKPNPNDAKKKPQYKCYNCNSAGHHISKCPRPRREKGSCFRCGKMGHKLQDCPEKPILAVEKFENSLIRQQHPSNNFECQMKFSFGSDPRASFECWLLTLLDSEALSASSKNNLCHRVSNLL